MRVSTGANCRARPWRPAIIDEVLMTRDGSRLPAPPRSLIIRSLELEYFFGTECRGICTVKWPLSHPKWAAERERTNDKVKYWINNIVDECGFGCQR